MGVSYDANSVLSGRRQLVVAGGKESRLEAWETWVDAWTTFSSDD